MERLLTAFVLLATLAVPGRAGYGFYPTKLQKTFIQRQAQARKAAGDILQDQSLAASSPLLYYGGPVISHVRVYPVFWGSSIDPAFRNDVAAFYKAVAAGSQLDWLNQYATRLKAVDGRDGTNQTIAHGEAADPIVIAPKNASKNLDDKDVQKEIEAQVAAGVLPKPTPNTLYMIHFPAGVSIAIDGQKSCDTFCAYHDGFNSAAYGPTFYGVMPDLNSGACSWACGGDFDATTETTSHELAEAVTDPFPTPGDNPAYPQAWNTNKGEEIADVCTLGSADLRTPTRTYKLTQLWDNSSGQCSAGPFDSSTSAANTASR